MHLHFKQAACLVGKDAAGKEHSKDYPLGVHQVHEDHLKSKFLKKLISAGLVVEPTPAEMVKPESVHERQLRLAEKLASQSKAKEVAAEESESSDGEQAASGEELSQDDDDQKEEQKPKHKKKR